MRPQALDDWSEGAVVDDNAVFGMVDDVGELIVEKPRIERVQDATHADDAKPGDEMAIVVHGKRGNPFPGQNAEPFERLSEATRLVSDLAPVGANHGPVGARGNDLTAAML